MDFGALFRAGALTALILLFAGACSGASSPAFLGTELNPEQAPEFTLIDHTGESVSLLDFRGEVVLLTFLYTNCPDVCPLVTANLQQAHMLLAPEEVDRVNFLTISVDPRGDNMEQVREYTRYMGMEGRWRYLIGAEEELSPIWSQYWLAPVVTEVDSDPGKNTDGDAVYRYGPHEHPEGYQHTLDEKTVDASDSGYLVGHTAPIFLIDASGVRRVLFNNLFLDPADVVNDLRILMEEAS